MTIEEIFAMETVVIPDKLRKLGERLKLLSDEDRAIVTDSLSRIAAGGIPLIGNIPRIARMQIPGEPATVDPLLQDETVSVARKYLDDVIWRYMPIEGLFAMLLNKTLHFSPLLTMKDSAEGELPPKAFARASSELPDNCRQADAISPDEITRQLVWHRKATASISCWYVGETDSRSMWDDYAPRNGVAIRTTVRRLFSSLRKINDTNIHIDRVVYFEADDEAAYAELAYFGSLYIKYAEGFRQERELRAVASNGRYLSGLDIPIDVSVLIESLVLSPDLKGFAAKPMTAAIQQFGISFPIDQSLLPAKESW